jgi:two-component system cell cycle sensor histidine kinase/response regulator CckA
LGAMGARGQRECAMRKVAVARWIWAALILALLALSAGGTWIYKAYRAGLVRHTEEDLTAVARLKVSQIVQWRRERLADAEVLMETPPLAEAIRLWMEDEGPDRQCQILAHFRALAQHYNYSDVSLVDTGGRVRLSLTGHEGRVHQEVLEAMTTAFRLGRPGLTDLHEGPGDLPPHTDVVAPVVLREGDTARPLAAVVLRNEAQRFLYPIVQSWPTPSATAETLLVRREDGEVLLLSQPRHAGARALRFRMPLSWTERAEVMAVLGPGGIFHGRDYRGVKVVSMLQPIPDSPWYIVAKEDSSEALAPVMRESLLLIALICGVAVLLVAGTVALWQRNLKAHYRALYRSEAARRASEERLGLTLRSIADGVIATDAQGRVELLNPVAEALTGWRQEDAAGRPIEEVFSIINEETRQPVENPVARVLREGVVVGLANHTLLIARDGTERPVADSGAPIRDEKGGILGVVLAFRDRSEERAAQRVAQARSDLIEYAADRSSDDFLKEALDRIGALVQSPLGLYHLLEPDERTLSLQRWSSRTLDGLCKAEGGHLSVDRAGLWADCVRQKRPVIHNDFASLPGRKELPEGHPALGRLLLVPVVRGEKVVAVFGLGNKPVDYTDRDAEAVSYLAGIVWGVAERLRTEEALRQSEQRYRTLVENLNDVIFHVDPEGRITYMSPAIERMSHYRAEELLGRRFTSLLHPEDLPEMVGRFRGVLDGQIEPHEFRVVDKDGSVRFVRTHSRPLMEGGRVVGVIGVMTDITDRRLAEAERERLLAAIEQAGEVVVITDADGAIEYVNPAFEKVTGYSREEVLGQNPRILKSGKQDLAFYQDLWGTISSGRTWSGRMVNRKKDGTFYTEDSTISPVLDGSGRIVNYVAVKRDVTEHLRLAAQFQQAQKMEAVGRLAGGVAHDFNNMLTAILGYVGLALSRVGGDVELREDLLEVRKAAERSADLVKRLLAFARRQVVRPVVLDLNDVVEDLLKMLRRLIGEEIDLVWEPGGGLWRVRVDPSQVDQILANLCVNAKDAISGAGRVVIETGNVVFDEAYCRGHEGFVPGQYVMLAVSDDGCGMTKEVMEHLFEPFFTTKEVGKGTGLGLAAVYGIVKQNNGFVNVYSELGKGTTVKVYLPRWTGEGEVVGESKRLDVPRGMGETVLVVEDEEAVLRMARAMLESLGYTVLTASSPAEAMEVAAGHSGEIDLALVDVVMPEMHGKELVGRLKALRPTLRHLYMSGYTANVIATRGLLGDGVPFIQKPFSLERLARKVREAMRRKED